MELYPHSPMCLHGVDRADFISALRGNKTREPNNSVLKIVRSLSTTVTTCTYHVYIPRVRTPTDTSSVISLPFNFCVSHKLIYMPSACQHYGCQCLLVTLNTDMSRLTTGIRSEKCVVRRFRRCANVIERTYTNLDSIAYYTARLYGIANCS